MTKRPIPASLLWLGALVALAVACAVVAGWVLYAQSRRLALVQADAMTGGSSEAGRVAIAHYGCGSCHAISGVRGASGQVGPDLSHVGQRAALAGSLPNDPVTMIRWLCHPQRLRPGSGMPEMGVTVGDARDMAAFLYAQD